MAEPFRDCDFGQDIKTWHVAFGDFHPGGRHWWHLFARSGWRHVLVFGYSRGGWIVIDPLMGHTDVRVAMGEEIDRTIAVLKAGGGRILRVERIKRYRWMLRGPVYCVTTVKHLLGMGGLSFTPEQLYHALLRQGATEVFR